MSETDGLLIGYDLCSDFVRISCYRDGMEEPEDFSFDEEGLKQSIAVLLCKKRGEESWAVGEEALQQALSGQGIMVDDLLGLIRRNGMTTIEDVQYSALELFVCFLKKTLELVQHYYQESEIKGLFVAVPGTEAALMETVYRAVPELGLSEEQVRIMSHGESLGHYIEYRGKGSNYGITAAFDLTKMGLDYYEAVFRRGSRALQMLVRNEALEEHFSLDILKQKTGARMADSILSSCAERLFHAKNISEVYLTGEGLAHCQEWSENFLDYICKGRRVRYHHNLFAQGALYWGMCAAGVIPKGKYQILSDGLIPSEISMEILQRNQKKRLILCAGGCDWYEAGTTFELIPEKPDAIEMQICRLFDEKKKLCRIPLEGIPARPEKTTRLEIQVYFTSPEEMQVRITDLGFGEFFPPSGVVIEQKVYIG